MSIKRISGEMIIRPNDYLYHIPCSDNYVNVMQMPQGNLAENEIGDTVYEAGGYVAYHDHDEGYETFLTWNPVDCIINGKRFLMESGDLLQIVPHLNHGFTHVEEGSIWREMFQGIQMYAPTAYTKKLYRNYPDIQQDPAFKDMLSKEELGSYFRVDEDPVTEDVSKYDVPQLKPAEWAFSRYTLGAVELGLKVGRWEFGGAKEVWEIKAKNGVTLSWGPYPQWGLFNVMSGKIDVIADDDRGLAAERDIINIHPYQHYKLVFKEDTVVLANNVKSQLFRAMEERKALMHSAPGSMENKEEILALLRRHGCYLTDYHYEEA